jgi:hypothetical protein
MRKTFCVLFFLAAVLSFAAQRTVVFEQFTRVSG